jgi:DNA relaxase NicK
MSNYQNLDYPYFIIAAGPTASGKSSAIDKISNYFKNDELNSKKHTEFISVDALIEKNPYLKQEVDNYFKKNFKNKKNEIYNELAYPTNKTIKFFNKVYWNARKNTDCITGHNLNFKNKTI